MEAKTRETAEYKGKMDERLSSFKKRLKKRPDQGIVPVITYPSEIQGEIKDEDPSGTY